jgi:outer membrane receptor for ferrienterochelin and colicins
MKQLFVFVAMLWITSAALAQNTYKAVIRDAQTNQPLAGATVKVTTANLATKSNDSGAVSISNIPSGRQMIQYSFVGYQTKLDTLSFPLSQDTLFIVTMEPAQKGEHLEEVIITATRSSRTIDNMPTRVEVIAGEELDEKGNMKPGDIRMLLAESTGIQTQQTSATSGNSAIRIQGLDGKYTQIIRDGFPLYSGFSGGLGLLQIAPLDLQQVEVIKGSSSTLYGGGAIAGLVNLVSKKPTDERQLNFLLNGTSALGFDGSGLYAQKFDKVGMTVYAAYNKGSAYDPSDIGLTAISKFDRFILNPKLYVYFDGATTLSAGLNATTEKRIGGDINFVKGKPSVANPYFEKNTTGRYSSQLELVHNLGKNERMTIRNSVSYYDRSISLPAYQFSGVQVSTYSEANYSRNTERTDWVFGVNLLTDNFTEDKYGNNELRSYNHSTIGGFVQNTWTMSNSLSMESGVRGDYHNDYGFFFLPRISGLWKINERLSTRLGAGMGYKAPTVFTEDAERIQFRNVLPLNVAETKAERSFGLNYDVNYQTSLFDGNLGFSINHMFFYTRINDPLLLTELTTGSLAYQQPKGNLNTKGMETNAKVTYGDFKLFIGYTLADVNQRSEGNSSTYPLVSKHRLNNVLMYEVEDKWKIGAEAYYYGRQKLNDGAIGKSYWTAGLMAEKVWERFSIFINFENFTNTRQTKFDTIYTGRITSPVFRDIYAPVDGFVVNGGVKIRL